MLLVGIAYRLGDERRYSRPERLAHVQRRRCERSRIGGHASAAAHAGSAAGDDDKVEDAAWSHTSGWTDTYAEAREASMMKPRGRPTSVAERGGGMDVQRLAELARDQLTVGRVFGEPIERGAVTVIPVARVMGGAGGGQGTDDSPEGPQQGEGGGWGVVARPAGVYVVDGERVRFKPVVDLDRAVLTAAAAGVVMSLVWVVGRRRAQP